MKSASTAPPEATSVDRSIAPRRRGPAAGTGGSPWKRLTYVVDRNGIVRHIFRSQFRAGKHIAEALKALESEASP